MIQSGGRADRGRFDPVGRGVERLAVGAEADVTDELASFELPPILLDRLRPPLAQLGFAFAPVQLPSGAFPEPLSYTLAKNGGTELFLLHIPSIFFRATRLVVLAANGLGYAFAPQSRLHLFAEDRDAVPQYLESSIKAWNNLGIVARFHPWMRMAELQIAPDTAAFAREMFDLAAEGLQADDRPSSELTMPQYKELRDALRSAFRDERALATMLLEELDRLLDDIAAPGRFPDRITDVIQEAQTGGWVRQLIEGALRAKPGNPRLRRVAESVGGPLPPEGGAG